jgi:hypothetical protein
MMLDELLKLMEATGNLNPVQEIILRQAWDGKTYSSMAEDYHFDADYLKKVAHKLWHLVSALLGKSISKTSFRAIVESLEITYLQKQFITSHNDQFLVKTPSNLNIIEFPGSLVPLNSPFYIERLPLETNMYQEIEKPGNILWIKAPQKMGKSSLLERIMARAASQGYQTIYIDFQQVETANLSSLNQFLKWLCVNMTWQMKLEPKLDDFWDDDIGSKVSFSRYLRQYLLSRTNHPVVMSWDGINLLFQYPEILQEILLLLRSWSEEAKRVEVMKKLRFVLVHSTEVEIPSSPSQLNYIGLPIQLPPFTVEQVQDLALRYQLDWVVGAEGMTTLETLQALLGGHPYLVQLTFYYLARDQLTLEQLLQDAPTPSGIYGDHLRHYLSLLKTQPELTNVFREVVKTEKSIQLDPILAHRLENMGLVKLSGNLVSPSCQLYRSYFATHL